MSSLDALTNRGEYLSAHYMAEILPGVLKNGVLKQWNDDERHGKDTPRTRLRALRRVYNTRKAELSELDTDAPKYTETVQALHREILGALGFVLASQSTEDLLQPVPLVVARAGEEHTIDVVHSEPGIAVIESGFAVDADAAVDAESAGRLFNPVTVDPAKPLETAFALASYLLLGEENPPRYVVILSGAVVILADRLSWFEGRYLAVSLDVAFGRNDTSSGGELDVIAALFSAEALRTPPEGGAEALAALRDGSRQHAVGVSADLRKGLRLSVEVIANEVLARIREAGIEPEDVMDPAELGKELARESLRYLYRILFLLYAEARPELGVLPVDDRDYVDGYSLARLGEVASRKLIGEAAERGFHFYESLDLLFRMVNQGHNPRGPIAVEDKASEGEGIRFEPLKSDLFLPEKTKLIGRVLHPDDDEDDPEARWIDTRLRNACLHQVLRWLMIARGKRKGRGGFISYAQLGINQLGAVYEGLMSYTGFIATEELYEVAKKGDPKDGSWMIPASKVDDYPGDVFVERRDEETGVPHRVRYDKGAFVYRLAGRDRQTSASYYTPQSLTQVTVELAIKYRLEEEGREVKARDLLNWTICEPALGSGAFLNEAINQVAAKYLSMRQKELGQTLGPEQYGGDLQRVKAYIALHNCYGVDLNATAVELAEVSIWLNTMHPGLQAPWFGLHLRRGNSLIGCGRKTYTPEQLADKSWLKTAPTEYKLRDGALPDGVIHHFLLPAEGWGAVASNAEAKALAPEEAKRLANWRKAMLVAPSAKKTATGPSQVQRLQTIARRVEYLWNLVLRRLEISEREIRREIKVWGADDLPPAAAEAVLRDKILNDLESVDTPYWRLKTVMDTWCAFWSWPLDKVDELSRGQGAAIPLTTLDEWISFLEAMVGRNDIPDAKPVKVKNTGEAKPYTPSLLREFETLDALEDFEDSLPALMGMDRMAKLADRLPWLAAIAEITEDQGVFHWDLTFGYALAKGGFDLQVGNPPWVKPRWLETEVLSELDPWFALLDASDHDRAVRKRSDLSDTHARSYFLREAARNRALASWLVSDATYRVLANTQPDLYRGFMVRSWEHAGSRGTIGMIHPDTHLTGPDETRLRAASYPRLRLHAHFSNLDAIFPDIRVTRQFGVNIYGSARSTLDISFQHASWLFDARSLIASLSHSGNDELPGMRYRNKWDVRPHRSRLVTVNHGILEEWNRVRGQANEPVDQTPILYPITTAEEHAIAALADSPRLARHKYFISSGLHEKDAKTAGLIDRWTGRPETWDEVILRAPHFSVATPFSKEAPNMGRSGAFVDLVKLDTRAIPATDYRRSSEVSDFVAAHNVWDGRSETDFYRLMWREMVPFDTERSLYPALFPPGPSHVHAVMSLAMPHDRDTVIQAGFWSSLPLDYLLRITGRGHLGINEVQFMPVGEFGHPLAAPLTLRVLRLNCLTSAYAALWEKLFAPTWERESWAVFWPNAGGLGSSPSWSTGTALRSELERRAALVEIDCLVAVWLGIGIDELLSIYRARYPVLSKYDASMWFDHSGRKLSPYHDSFGQRQTKEHYDGLMAHLDDPANVPHPEGYTPPFYKANREREYREAHAVFTKRLQDAIHAGWQSS